MIFDNIIKKIKGEPFVVDSQISRLYLFSFFARKAFRLLYGVLYLRKMKLVYCAPSARVRAKKYIKFQRNLSLDIHVNIDALSQNGICFGRNVSVGKYTTIECTGSLRKMGKGLVVGNNVGLGTHGFFGCAGGVEIGDDTIFGNYVSIHSENHNYSRQDLPIRLQGVNSKGIKIGKDCWIGAKVTILDGTEIGEGCIVAAGAVVRGKIPAYSIIAGVPAKVIKTRI